MFKIFTKILLILHLLVVFISCNAVKHVSKGSYLLTKNTITVNNKRNSTPKLQSYLRQKPNQKILGIPFSLYLYNLGNPDTLAVRWPASRPKFRKWISNTFSEKQAIGLERTSKGLNKWFLKSGNAPIISDQKKIKKSAEALQAYYFNQGYWDTTVDFKENKKDTKRIDVEYNVITHKPYFLDTISSAISSPALDSLYKKNSSASFLKQDDQFNADNFEKEQDRLVKLYRNSGVFKFGKGIMEFDIDTTKTSSRKHNILLKIPDRIVEKNDSIYTEPFKIQKVNRINVYTDFSFNTKDDKQKDSATYNNIHFFARNQLKYNPKYLASSIIIQPDSVYRDSERDLTRKYLRELQNFRPSIDIKYIENKDESLTANIYLTPLKKYSLGWDAEFTTSNIKPFGILGKLSFLNRNVFKGAEILELSFQGSFLNTTLSAKNSNFFNAWEIGSSISLKIPRILFPLNTRKLIPKRMAPKTNISLAIALQRNIGLDRQNITGNLEYTWQSSSKSNHKIELLNLQYIKNQNTENYFTVYQSELAKLNLIAFGDGTTQGAIPPLADSQDSNGNLIPLKYIDYVTNSTETPNIIASKPTEYLIVDNVRQRRDILTEDILVPVISYTFNYNNRAHFKDNNFSTFSAKLISSGSISSLFAKKPANKNQKELFGLPIAQYIKTEIEHKKYWAFSENSSLVFRNFIGIAFPFGNSNQIPFSRSYRAGGSNDIRAWNTFNLGPGSELSTLEFNVGSLKFTSNLEYRFKLINNLNAALFIDAGNIWDITNSSLLSNAAKFNGFSSLKDIAIGSGFGARYDFKFLIFRLDVGFKTYEPYNVSGKKWFQNYNFNNAVYNIGINYPF